MKHAVIVSTFVALALAVGCSKSDSAASNGGSPRAGNGSGGSAGQGSGGTAGKGSGGTAGKGSGGAGAGGGAGNGSVSPSPLASIPGHGDLLQDTSPKEPPRLLPTEVYIRSYLNAFGGLAPVEMQAKLKALDSGLFDTWNDYLTVLGLPDLRLDVPRSPQPNTLMVAAFERVGVALCDLAVFNDLKASPPPAVGKRVIFAFDLPKEAITKETFAPRFDVLHRTFLGYPAKLSLSAKRQERYFDLYAGTVAAHKEAGAPKGMTPEEAGWAAVCYGLARHPEFHHY